jgi:succinate dehydrogenase / fumarate reductase membrane anchor subunit
MPKISKDRLLNAPLKNAKGMGSTHHGHAHWMAQKITAIANLPLVLWLVWSIVSLYSQGASYELFTSWVAQPLHTILLVALFISVFYHAVLGAQVVAEDYISNVAFRKFKIIGSKLFLTLLTIACVFSVLKIAFTAGV